MSEIGVEGEDRLEFSKEESKQIRRRSLKLLGEVMKPSRGVLIFSVFLVIGGQLASVAYPAIIAWGINTALPAAIDGDWTLAFVAGFGLIMTGVLNGGLLWLFIRVFARAAQDVLLRLRTRLYRHTQRLSMQFHESYTSGRVIARQTSDLDSIREFLGESLVSVVTSFLYMLFTLIALILIDPISALFVVVAFVPIGLLSRWFQRHSERNYRASRIASAKLIVKFVETMTGMRAVQAFRAEERNDASFGELNHEYVERNTKSVALFAVYTPGMHLFANITLAFVVLSTGFRVLEGQMSVGLLLAVFIYVRQFFQPLEEFAAFYNGFQSATAALEKISGVLAEKPTVAEPKRPKALDNAKGRLEFDGVEFSYVRGRKILPHFDLKIPAGQTIALVGTTGAGKTTLAKLVARFYDPSRGKVMLDGIPLNQLADESLRKAVVMVTQESYLFSGSIGENIALGKPDATLEEIQAAAKAVGAHEFITALPNGYDTDVNKRGGRLSAGQRQLVSFARAFIADPAVLILDEATSSLDIPSERLVQHALQTLLKKRTAIIIAHRLSTVAIADRVLVMEHGQIVEDGTPAALIAGKGRFAKLHTAWRDSLV